MAVIRTGSIVADIRGSVGAETYSRTIGGLIVKARSNPNQPESEFRDDAQAIFTAVTQGWSGRISESQRQAWNAYATRYPRPNRWGDPILTSGYLSFVRANCTIKQTTFAKWYNSPPTLGMLPAPVFDFQYLFFGESFFIDLQVDPAYPLKNGYRIIIAIGKACNVGVNYYSTPWRYLIYSRWTGSEWDPELDTIVVPEFSGAGDRIFAKATMIYYTTGRMSVPFQRHANAEEVGGKRLEEFKTFLALQNDL